MDVQHRNHLTFLDRALMHLLEERVRLVREAGRSEAPHLEDLLQRSTGVVLAPDLATFFEAVEQAGRRAVRS